MIVLCVTWINHMASRSRTPASACWNWAFHSAIATLLHILPLLHRALLPTAASCTPARNCNYLPPCLCGLSCLCLQLSSEPPALYSDLLCACHNSLSLWLLSVYLSKQDCLLTKVWFGRCALARIAAAPPAAPEIPPHLQPPPHHLGLTRQPTS